MTGHFFKKSTLPSPGGQFAVGGGINETASVPHKTLCSAQQHPTEIRRGGGSSEDSKSERRMWRKRKKNGSGMKEMRKRVRPPTSIEMDQSNLIMPRY